MKKLKKKQNGGTVNTEFKSSKDFFKEYLNSPIYKERLTGMGYSDPDAVVKERIQRLDAMRSPLIKPGSGNSYEKGLRRIIIDPNEIRNQNLTLPQTISHEMSHGIGALPPVNYDSEYSILNPNEVGTINQVNKAYKTYPEHDARAWEAKSDLDAFRYNLFKDKIYDTKSNKKFNSNDLKKAKERYKDAGTQRFFQNFKDADLIYLMNNIAAIQSSNNEPIAKNGISMKKTKSKMSSKIDFSTMYDIIPEAKLGASMEFHPKPKRRPKAQMGYEIAPTYSGQDPQASTAIPKRRAIPLTSKPEVATGPLGQRVDKQLASLANKGNGNTQPDMGGSQFDSMDILAPLALASSLIPEGDIRRQYVRPEDLPTNQQYMYGTGSQAIYRHGGQVEDESGWFPYIQPWDEDAYVGMQAQNGAILPYMEDIYPEDMPVAKDGKWIQKAINPKHKGYCTPMTKKTCTPRRKALAKRFKSGDLSHENGGSIPKAQQGRPVALNENYYQSSARLSHYKNLLNEQLKKKNPEAFSNYFQGLSGLRRSGKTQDASKYVQETPYNEYLTPDEVRGTLGDDDYNDYLQSIKTVNDYDVSQGKQPLYGQTEGENALDKLNYGRRFASLQITPSVSVYNQGTGKKYNRSYTYDPSKRQVNFTETGDLSLTPSYLKPAQPVEDYSAVSRGMKNGGKIKKAQNGISTDPSLTEWDKWMMNSKYTSTHLYDPYITESTVKKGNKITKVRTQNRELERDFLPTEVRGNSPVGSIPEPGYTPANLGQPTDYSISYPEYAKGPGAQKTAYYPNYDQWQGAVNALGNQVTRSQSRGDRSRASAMLNNLPQTFENGGIIADPSYPFYPTGGKQAKFNHGGMVNNTGYLDGYQTAQNPYNIIPGGDITMQGVSRPIMGVPIRKGNFGQAITMMPGQDYQFDADAVLEYPMQPDYTQTEPYYEEGAEYDLSPFTIKRLLSQGYTLE